MKAKLSMICIEQSNGSFFAECPDVEGCFTQGDTYEQACSNLKELVEITIDEDLDDAEKEFILSSKTRIFSEFEVDVKFGSKK